MNFIICRFQNGEETWINYSDIEALHEYSENSANYTKVYLKSGNTLIVEETIHDITRAIVACEQSKVPTMVS